ncbi:MAG: ORF6N domain-containing protein [bacterium]
MSEPLEVYGNKIEQTIYLIRGRRVMLSTDLARLYGVETKVLMQAVKRNIKRSHWTLCSRLSRKKLSNQGHNL